MASTDEIAQSKLGSLGDGLRFRVSLALPGLAMDVQGRVIGQGFMVKGNMPFTLVRLDHLDCEIRFNPNLLVEVLAV